MRLLNDLKIDIQFVYFGKYVQAIAKENSTTFQHALQIPAHHHHRKYINKVCLFLLMV